MSAEIIRNTEVFELPSVDVVGGKGLGLLRLKELSQERDFVVPDFYIIPVGYQYTEENLQELYKLLDGPLAVRSSSPYEDSEGLSFAGRFESVLDVDTFEYFKYAIQKVLDSANGEKAKSYAEQHGIEIDGRMAIIVQKMVKTHYAGVCYSSSNVEDQKTIMEYGYGTSENILSGVTQGYIAYSNNSGITIHYGESFRELESVADTTREIERHFGKVMDIEFAVTNYGVINILQARPITDPDWEKVELPQVDKSKLLLEADIVRGSGEFTGPVFMYKGPSQINKQALDENILGKEARARRDEALINFDRENEYGYCLITENMGEHESLLNLKLNNMKVLVTVDYASRFSHPSKVISELGIFYIGVLGRKDLLGSINTGDEISIASDQSKGIIYDLQKKVADKTHEAKYSLEGLEVVRFMNAISTPLKDWDEAYDRLFLSPTEEVGIIFDDYEDEKGVPTKAYYTIVLKEGGHILFSEYYRKEEAYNKYKSFSDMLIHLIVVANTKYKEFNSLTNS